MMAAAESTIKGNGELQSAQYTRAKWEDISESRGPSRIDELKRGRDFEIFGDSMGSLNTLYKKKEFSEVTSTTSTPGRFKSALS